MARYLVVLAILVGGIVWLLFDAPLIGRDGLLESESSEHTSVPLADLQAGALPTDFLHDPGKYCDLSDPACVDAVETAVAATRPTPLPRDPRVREVFLEDPIIQALIGDGQEGQDYWISIDYYDRPSFPGEPGAGTVVFAEPVSYEGEFLVGSDPCSGRRMEGRVDPADPCLDEQRDFSYEHRSMTDLVVLYGHVNVERRQVFNMFTVDISQYSIDRLIAQIEAEQE